MSYTDLVQPLIERRDLNTDQAREMMRYLVSGEATDAQIGAILMGLRLKGCTTDELAAFATVIREKAAALKHDFHDLVDTCGTGGGAPSFNISTSAAIVAAASGVRIAKHGNRAVTSKCGSVDVLESLGVKIDGEAEQLGHMLESTRIVFLFAQAHHSAMRYVGQARKDLGFRTVFNQLGPLSNPAGARRQLIGVYDPGLMRSMGEALNLLGCERGLIVHSLEGLDEISPVGMTEYVKVWDGRVTVGKFKVQDFGLDPIDPSALAPGETVEEGADILREAIGDVDSPRSKAILPSAGAAIWLAGLEETLPASVERARLAIQNGLATSKLQEIIQVGESS